VLAVFQKGCHEKSRVFMKNLFSGGWRFFSKAVFSFILEVVCVDATPFSQRPDSSH
jgi:hypothetical protein